MSRLLFGYKRIGLFFGMRDNGTVKVTRRLFHHACIVECQFTILIHRAFFASSRSVTIERGSINEDVASENGIVSLS